MGNQKSNILLLVSPYEAQKIAFAVSVGDVSLSMRDPNNKHEKVAIKPVTASTVIENFDELMPEYRTYKEYRGR